MNFDKLTVAKSVLNRELVAYNNFLGDNYIYIIAGMHGNEPEGVFVLERLFAWLETIDLTRSLIIIPQANPDGYKNKTRVNANMVDLNRNFPASNWSPSFDLAKYNPGPQPASEPETRFLIELFNHFPPEYVISVHSWKPMLNINTKGRELAGHIAKFNGYEIVDDIGYPTPGSLDNYLTEKYDCGVVTYECPETSSGMSLEEIWLENEHGLKDVFLNYF